MSFFVNSLWPTHVSCLCGGINTLIKFQADKDEVVGRVVPQWYITNMPRDGLFSFDAPKLEQTFVFNMIGLSIVSLVALSSCTFAAPATESGRDIRSNSGNAVTSITTTKATSSALEYLISL